MSRINRAAAGTWIPVHSHTIKVLKASNHLWHMSNGVFDIRHSPSPAAFGRGSLNRPPIEAFGGNDKTLVCKTGPWTIDLGGIAKGYAVDCAVERIRKVATGFETTGVVNAGGDLRVWGDEPVTIAAWVVERSGSWLRPLDVKRTAAATSMIRSPVNDKRFSSAIHLRMPEGKPLRKANPVTVFAKHCLWADALTKIVLLGSEHLARQCLRLYDARALVFGPRGDLMRAIG